MIRNSLIIPNSSFRDVVMSYGIGSLNKIDSNILPPWLASKMHIIKT